MNGMTPNGNQNQGSAYSEQGELRSDSSRYNSGIDWKSLFYYLLGRIYWILIAAVLCGGLAGGYTKLFVKPVYEATSKLYIAGSENTISMSDLQLGSVLTVDYQEVFKIAQIHETVKEKILTEHGVSKPDYSVSVSNPKGSHMLYITVSSGNPGEAKLIADAYSEVVQTYIEKQMELRKPQILESAQIPSSPVTPKLRSIILKAAGIGALAAIAVLVFLFLLDNKIRTGEDVEKATGLATLGMLPKQSENAEYYEKRHRGETNKSGPVAEIRQTLALDYAGDEVINAICSNIAFAGKKIKRIAITSHDANNGKTFLATRIAYGMTKRGKTVLLIDGDLRKSTLINRYGITHTKDGLSHYLSGQAELDGVIYQTDIPNLYLLPAGKLVQSPLSLLTSEEFDRLMEDTGREFDAVIVDTPPVGAVIDAAEIAKRCDGSILVLAYNKITKDGLQRLVRTMEQTQTPVIGCIINNVTMSKLDRKRYDYGYGYGYYYGNAEKKNRKRSGTRR